MLHIHDDRKIKDCRVCQQALKDIEKSSQELDRLGTWSFPKKMKRGIEYKVWQKKHDR